MPRRLEFRPPRFADDWSPKKAALSYLEDDDDDDDDDAITQPMLITIPKTTTERLGMEFVTIPGRDARPFTTIGPVAGIILFVLIISLTSLAIWMRRKRERRSIANNLDKVPLSATSAEGYCPYNVDADGMPTGPYAKLDQPNSRRFPNVSRLSQAGSAGRAARSERVRSLCDYDEPRQQPEVYAVSSKRAKPPRPQSCLIGMGDYDEPDFRIPLTGPVTKGARQSTVVVNEGARELALNLGVTSVRANALPHADEIYYSSLKDLESAMPSVDTEAATVESISDPDVVYYSSINLKGQATSRSTIQSSNSETLPLGTIPHDACAGANKDRAGCEDNNINGRKNMSPKGSKVKAAPQNDEESVNYDYLQLTDSDKEPVLAASTGGSARDSHIESMGYFKLAESQSPLQKSTSVAPSCTCTVPGQKSAGTKGVGNECVAGSDSVYNTLQRGKLLNTTHQSSSDDIYNVLILD